MKKWQYFVLVPFVIIALVFLFRIEILLSGVGMLAKLRAPVSANQVVNWKDPSALKMAAGTSSRDQPNIILIVADDLGFNDITFHGGVAGGSVPTPNIDSIAQQGVAFRNGYAANATCAPSRAALMSGKYPTRFGFEFTPTPPGMMRMISAISEIPEHQPQLISHQDGAESSLTYQQMGLPTEETTVAEVLKDAGYYTAHIGKWHLGRENGMSPIDQGFDDSLLMASGLYMKEDDPDVVNSKQDFDPIDRFLWQALQFAASFNGSDYFEPESYITDYYTDEAVKVIENNKDQPFFLYLAHWAPHTPLQASREDYEALSHIKDHRLRVYAAMIRALDRGIGRVLEAVDENGLSDNTLVIFTSDNGGAGYVGLDGLNDPYRGWKMSFYEGGVHVPYFMKWPGVIAPGSEYEAPVHHFDIFATAAGAAEAETSALDVDGVNLLPFLSLTNTTAAPHEALFWRSGHYQMAIHDGWKLQRSDTPAVIRLFNLKEDPTEENDVAALYPMIVTKVSAALDRHNTEQAEPAWPAQLEGVVPIDRTAAGKYEPDETFVYWPN